MVRSGTVNTIHEMAIQGKSIQQIAITLGLARNTVRKYLRNPSAVIPQPRRKRGSKLDPFKEHVLRWIKEDHCYNCESMLPRLQALGYTGSLSTLKVFVHPLRPLPLFDLSSGKKKPDLVEGSGQRSKVREKSGRRFRAFFQLKSYARNPSYFERRGYDFTHLP